MVHLYSNIGRLSAPSLLRGQIRSLNVRVSYSHSFFYLPFLKFFMTTLLQLGVNIIFLDILNSASRILQCWPYYVKINSARHQHDTERTQNRAGCSHRQLFRPLWSSSVWRNNQRKLWWKISAHSDLNPDPEPSTPTESHHTTCLLGRKSPSVKLMSRRENKELTKTNL